MPIKHNFSSAKSDGSDATMVQPSHWNADHILTNIVPLTATGAGAAQFQISGTTGKSHGIYMQVTSDSVERLSLGLDTASSAPYIQFGGGAGTDIFLKRIAAGALQLQSGSFAVDGATGLYLGSGASVRLSATARSLWVDADSLVIGGDIGLSRATIGILSVAVGDRIDQDAVGAIVRKFATQGVAGANWAAATGYGTTPWSNGVNLVGDSLEITATGVYEILFRANFPSSIASRLILGCGYAVGAVPGSPSPVDEHTLLHTGLGRADVHHSARDIRFLTPTMRVLGHFHHNAGSTQYINFAELSVVRINR